MVKIVLNRLVSPWFEDTPEGRAEHGVEPLRTVLPRVGEVHCVEAMCESK